MTDDNSIKYHIHIVDDSKLVIQSIVKTLNKNDYEISYTSNGKDALDTVAKNKPHLIILDVEMPIMDGYETIKNLKRNPETSDIPVIFLTSITKPDAIKKLFELGASDYITKPCVDEELLARIEKEINTITLQRSLKDKMSRLADAISHDSLTKVYNRIYLTSLINRSMEKLSKDGKGIFSLIYLDIDYFNSFNTMHGLKNSDRALHKFATVVKSAIRDKDILARWEGDKFLAMIPQVSKKQLQMIVENIDNAIKKTSFSTSTNLTCSMILLEINKKENLDDIMLKLQDKMKDALKAGRGTIIMVEN